MVLVAAGVTVTTVVFETLLNFAVRVTAVFAETVPALAVNLAVEEPAGTVTEADTGKAELLLESVTADDTVAAAESVTVHAVDVPEETVVGEQASDVSVGEVVEPTVTDPLVTEGVTAFPFPNAALTVLSGREMLLAVPVVVSLTVRDATTPAAIVLAFTPLTTHVSFPAAGLQFSVLLAPVAEAPAAAVTEATSDVG